MLSQLLPTAIRQIIEQIEYRKSTTEEKIMVGTALTGPTKARVISSIDFENKTFHCTTQTLSYKVWGFSHRWEVRDGAETWHVVCGNEQYSCLMFPHEASNIQGYFDSVGCSGLWLDYVCIDQNDEEDKCAQVGIMGTLYMATWGK